jgi:hypothetical protein
MCILTRLELNLGSNPNSCRPGWRGTHSRGRQPPALSSVSCDISSTLASCRPSSVTLDPYELPSHHGHDQELVDPEVFDVIVHLVFMIAMDQPFHMPGAHAWQDLGNGEDGFDWHSTTLAHILTPLLHIIRYELLPNEYPASRHQLRLTRSCSPACPLPSLCLII